MDDAQYYRTVITLEVLSDRPIGDIGLDDLEDVAFQCFDGDFSGAVVSCESEEVGEEEMAELLIAQGSDPSFLIMDDEEDEE